MRFDLWPKMWSILENLPCALEKKVYSSAFGWNVLRISMRPSSSNVSFKTCVSSIFSVLMICPLMWAGYWSLLLLLCYCQFLLLCLLCCLFDKHLYVLRWSYVGFISSVQSLSRVRLFVTPWIAAHQTSLSITNSQSSLKLTTIDSVMPSSHLILCPPFFLLPLIPPSIRVFSNESTLCIRWPKYWSFSFSIISSKEILGLISFRMDWLDLLGVQGTPRSLLQQHRWKASILQHSAFFTSNSHIHAWPLEKP